MDRIGAEQENVREQLVEKKRVVAMKQRDHDDNKSTAKEHATKITSLKSFIAERDTNIRKIEDVITLRTREKDLASVRKKMEAIVKEQRKLTQVGEGWEEFHESISNEMAEVRSKLSECRHDAGSPANPAYLFI